MTPEGKYIYCIIDAQEEKDFGSTGIGGRGDRVHSFVFEDIAAVVSDTPVIKYPISKENTLAHMKVMEMVMKDCTILPVKFGTIASGNKSQIPEQRIKLEILKARHKEIKELFSLMKNKVELGLKAMWIDMKFIFEEIVEENTDIKILKQRISSGNSGQTYGQRIKLGEMVKKALETKKFKEEEEILKILEGVYYELRRNKTFGDNMIMNSAFLVDKARTKAFDNLIEKLISTYNNRTRFKYVGPIPPCNFVELVITLKGDEKERAEESTYGI